MFKSQKTNVSIPQFVFPWDYHNNYILYLHTIKNCKEQSETVNSNPT